MSFVSGLRKFYNICQVWINLLLVAAVSFGLFWGTIKFLDHWTNHGQTTEMPNVVDLDFNKARDILESKGFDILIDSIYNTQVKHGQVIDQKPVEGEIVKYGRTVYLKINSFYPQMKPVDADLVHLSSLEAKKKLEAYGFTRIVIDTIPGENDDEVVEIKYNGKKLAKGDSTPITAEVRMVVVKADIFALDSMSVEEANAQVQFRDSIRRMDSLQNQGF